MIPKTDFHCITTWVARYSGRNLSMPLLILWLCIYCPDGAIIQYKYLNRVYFNCKTKLCLIVPGRQGKYIFKLESFFLQCILDDINKQDTFFLNCKHKHMMKSGAPPEKFEALLHLFPIELHGFTIRTDFYA